jgi:ABC-type Fe3+/spermidine/putrescine transport system ATPase subunit
MTIPKSDARLAAPVIGFDGVSLAFSGRTIISELSLTIGRGEIVCVVGPSGCGKTTALRMAGGLVRPDKGVVRLLGEPLRQGAAAVADGRRQRLACARSRRRGARRA